MKSYGRVVKHIDNGGIVVEVKRNEHDNVVIEMEASYFGYPAVQASLNTYGDCECEDKFLEELGLMFIQAAAKCKAERNDQQCKSTNTGNKTAENAKIAEDLYRRKFG